MYLAHRRPPLARRAASVAIVLAVHALAVAGFFHVRARNDALVEQVTIQMAFLDGPQQELPVPHSGPVPLLDVKPFIPRMPQVDVPVIAQAPMPAAITVSAPTEAAPPTTLPRTSSDAPVVVASVDYLKPPAPRYPLKARRMRAEGTVLLQVLVDTQGHAREVRVHRSSGHEELDTAAREAVLAAAFRPYVEDGVVRSALVIVPVEFALTIRTASR